MRRRLPPSRRAWPRASHRPGQGTLYLILAGESAVVEKLTPVLEALSSARRYVGATGKAAQVKALVNMVMNINTAGLAEGLGIGDALGIDLTLLREIFSQTGANSRVLETDGADMQAREHDCYFSPPRTLRRIPASRSRWRRRRASRFPSPRRRWRNIA